MSKVHGYSRIGGKRHAHGAWAPLVVFFCLWFQAPAIAADVWVKNGIADLRHQDLSSRTIELSGDWLFYWNRVLTSPDLADPAIAPDSVMPVPGFWNSPFVNAFPTQGVATYRVTLLLPKTRPEQLGFKINAINYAYRFYVDDRLVGQGGRFPEDPAGFDASSRPALLSFTPAGERVEVLVQVGNDNLIQPGLWAPVHFGSMDRLVDLRLRQMSVELVIFGGMLVMAIYHVGLVFTRKRSREILYFAMLTFSVALITVSSGEFFIFQVFPQADWTDGYRLFHVGWYSGVCWLYLFVATMYPDCSRGWMRATAAAIATVSIAALFVLAPESYLKLQDFYNVYTVLVALLVWRVLFMAVRRKHEGALMFFAGFTIFAYGIISDISHAYGVADNTFLVPVCFVIFLTVQALVLARQYARTFQHVEDLQEELQKKAHELEARVKFRTSELEAATSLAKRASRAKSDFLATMSHEIRTPMNGMIGMLELLRDAPLPAAEKHYLRTLDFSTRALNGIINDILDFSKIEAGQLQIEEQDFSLQELIEECASMFGARSVELGTTFNISVLPALPERIVSDPTRVRQILLNLLSNAFKFTTRGEVSLCVSVSGENGAGVIKFEVTDTGIGIAEDKQQVIFRSFEQLDAGTTRRYGGTGLGLAISKKLVEMLGGDIGFHSEPGRGSSFWFTIRAKVAAPPQSYLWLREQRDRLRVIIADSHPFRAAALIQQYLALNIPVTHCARKISLERALQKEAERHVIVIDDEFDGDGLAWLSWRRAQLPLNTLIIATVGFGQSMRLHADASLHQIQLIEKPYVPSKTVDMVMQWLESPLKQATKAVPAKLIGSQMLRPLRIAVAEDNPVNRKVIEGLLKKIGQRDVAFFENGKELITHVEDGKHNFDLVLMDIDMPVMDGYEATVKLREMERHGQITSPIIIGVSAKVLDEHEQLARQLGMNDYLRKPVRLDEIISALERQQALCA